MFAVAAYSVVADISYVSISEIFLQFIPSNRNFVSPILFCTRSYCVDEYLRIEMFDIEKREKIEDRVEL